MLVVCALAVTMVWSPAGAACETGSVLFFYHNVFRTDGGDEFSHNRISFSQFGLLSQRHGQHSSDVSLWTVQFHGQTKPPTNCLNPTQVVEVVWTSSSDPYFDRVLLELQHRMFHNFDHIGKRCFNICKKIAVAPPTMRNLPSGCLWRVIKLNIIFAYV